MNERILQIRTDALVAEYIYTKKLNYISFFSVLVTCLTIIVPVLFSSAAFIAKGTYAESWMNIASGILSAVLVCFSILALIFKIDQKRENCLIGRRLNVDISSDALDLLEKVILILNGFIGTLPRWTRQILRILEVYRKSNRKRLTDIL
ncbi:mobilome CxxCx(11)CxxC protein [Kushneria sp. EE4]